MNNKEQELLAKVIDLFAQRFDKNAILRGGMVLRILGSQRYTNDLDYVFVPYSSKNQIVKSILDCLAAIDGAKIQHSLNSKCLRIVLSVQDTTIQIDITVAKEIASDIASNKLMASQFNLPPRLVHITDHSVSMANKLAAWNERRLMRDIYDIWFFIRMEISPDIKVLEKRLKKPKYARTIDARDYFKGGSCEEFFEFLRQRVNAITQKEVEEELSDYFTTAESAGLALQFKSAFAAYSVKNS